MLHSLRLRLLLTMSLVVIATVATLALFTSRSTTTEFQRYVANDVARDQRVVSQIISTYQTDKAPQDKEALARQVTELARETGVRLIVGDGTGTVVADSDGKLVGQKLDWPPAPKDAITGATVPFQGQVMAVGGPPPPGLAGTPITGSAGLTWNLPAPTGDYTGPVHVAISAGVPLSDVMSVNVAWKPPYVPLASI